jgi:hypothetical protein
VVTREPRGGCGARVPTRKRSMTRWSGSWERSAMWAMWRSAESRVRESSEGGRIGPDLNLAPLLYPPPREAKAHSLAAEVPASRNPRLLRAARLLCRQGRTRRTATPAPPQSTTFHRSFPACPPASPSIFAPVLDHRGRWCDGYDRVGRAATSLARGCFLST